MVYSHIHHWKTKNMATAKSTAASSEIIEQYEKQKKFGMEFFIFPSLPKGKIKAMKNGRRNKNENSRKRKRE